MAPRRNINRAPLESRSYREPLERGGSSYSPRNTDTFRRSELDRDFAAMKRVWQMLRAGAVRMVGEIGRQY